MKCYNCRTEIENDTKYCPACGAEQGFDEELIEAAKAGDEHAVAELYTRTYNNVYQSIRMLINDEDTVLDILQDAYIRAFRSLNQLQDHDKFRPWVKTIGANTAKNYLTKKKPFLFGEMAGEEFMDWQNCKDADYWKYTMPKDGRMKFYFKPASIDYEADEIGAGWKIGVYTSSGADPIYETVVKGDTVISPNFAFKAGRNLYIKVSPENKFYSHCPDYLDYKLKPISYASTVWENESNNTRSTAKRMTLGKAYYGNIANTVALPADISWDRDYFKVTATKTGKMKIYFGNKSSDYNAKDGWKLQIRTSSKVLKTTDFITKTYSSKRTVATINVKKGQTIYVRVSCGENYWWKPAPQNVDYKVMVRY